MSDATNESPVRSVLHLMPFGVMLATGWMLLSIVAITVFPLVSNLSITDIDLSARLAPPLGFGGDLSHPLGTDDLGRDVLARLVASIRTSLLIALGAVATVSYTHLTLPTNREV